MAIKRLSIRNRKHSVAFQQLLAAAPNSKEARLAIRAITHCSPLLVFWVTPSGEVLDAGNAHHDNPPQGDRSVLSDPTNKDHLRGRSALIGDVIYIVIYGDSDNRLTRRQHALLRRAYPRILTRLVAAVPSVVRPLVDDARFIDETGDDIQV